MIEFTAEVQHRADEIVARMEAIDLAQQARDRAEERTFIRREVDDFGVIDLGGESG